MRGTDINLQDTEKQRKKLLREIAQTELNLKSKKDRIEDLQKSHVKILESNERNQKRLMRYNAKILEIKNHSDSPEHLLAFSGFMNEYVQAFMINHNFEMNINEQQILNPDNMSYEQLLDLGEQIGRVSKGLNKKQRQKLYCRRYKQTELIDKCPICCTEFEENDEIIILRCKHTYHKECLQLWLVNENTCPICKEYVVQQSEI